MVALPALSAGLTGRPDVLSGDAGEDRSTEQRLAFRNRTYLPASWRKPASTARSVASTSFLVCAALVNATSN